MSMPVRVIIDRVDPEIARAVVPLLKAYADRVERLAHPSSRGRVREVNPPVTLHIHFTRWVSGQGETYERANKVGQFLSANGFAMVGNRDVYGNERSIVRA